MPQPPAHHQRPLCARARLAFGVTCLLLCWLFLAQSAHAAEIMVESATEEVIVVLDDQDQRSTPAGWKDVPGGSHTLGVRATPFGPIVFSEVIELAEEQRATIEIDIGARQAKIEVKDAVADDGDDGQSPPEEDAPDPSEATPTETSPVAAEPPPTPKPVGDVYVISDEEGALILLNGVETAFHTPAMLRDISVGEHEITLTTECGRAKGTVAVKEGLIGRVELVLQQGDGSLSITSTPEGATIILDGQEIGSSPRVIKEVQCGGHSIVLRAPGFLETARTIRTPSFEVTEVSIELIEETYGTLVVAPTPLEAAIRIDGMPAGKGPMTIGGVGSGTHTLEITASGYQPWQNDFDIYHDQITRLDMVLLPENPRRGLPDLPWGRLALDTGVTGAGVALGVLAYSDFRQANEAFQVYLDEPDDDVAEAWFEEEVAPLKRRSAIEGISGLALIGVGAALWATTDFQVAVVPGGLGIHTEW